MVERAKKRVNALQGLLMVKAYIPLCAIEGAWGGCYTSRPSVQLRALLSGIEHSEQPFSWLIV